MTVPSLSQNQAQHPDLPNVTVKPVNLELTITPEPPTLDQHRAQYPASFNITVQPLDLGLAVTPEPAEEVGHSTVLQPDYPEGALPHADQSPSQHPNLTEVTVHPADVELPVPAGSGAEAEPSPAMQETPRQPPEPAEEVVAQYPFHQEGTVSPASEDKGQQPLPPSIPVSPALWTWSLPRPQNSLQRSNTLQPRRTPQLHLRGSLRAHFQIPRMFPVSIQT